ncbi:MAG: hypothetical protein R2788_09295 [Saprospiraceae bacterium]
MVDNLFVGIAGSLLLVIGAAWPEKKSINNPRDSIKNWMFLIGNLIMLGYALLQYLQNGVVYFVLLEILIFIATILMMLNFKDKWKAISVGISGVFLTGWALLLFDKMHVLIFITGLITVGLGYVFENNTLRRDVALTVGSLLIVAYSLMEEEWVFFWLNLFFSIFSGYYLIRKLMLGKP